MSTREITAEKKIATTFTIGGSGGIKSGGMKEVCGDMGLLIQSAMVRRERSLQAAVLQRHDG